MKKIILLLIIIPMMNCNGDKGTAPQKDSFELMPYEPVPVTKSNTIALYAHYMPWFESKEINGQWGSHWTMATRNPDIVGSDGNRQIAAHFYPLIGPYSSLDDEVIDYHLLLMKLSGIDGVFIDWYGTFNVYDYTQLRINSEALIERLEDVGLSFAIVYEDYTAENVLNQNQANSAIEAARADIRYLNDHYFTRDQYLHIDNAPLLMVFGPRYFQTESEWTQILTGLDPKPHFLTLWFESSDAGANCSGEFAWVYRNHLADLNNFYSSRVPQLHTAIGSAYPGFKDFYAEGGWGPGLGWEIAHHSTQTLSTTLSRAAQSNIPMLQLVTWNDFGEGTMIEPTEEFGYSLLETVQQFAGVTYTESDLKLVYKLYELRKKFKKDAELQRKLDQVFYYLVSLQVDKGEELLEELDAESD